MTCRRSFLTWITTALAALFGLPRAAKGATYHPGHQCPRCGATVFVVWRMNWPYPGRHGHRHGGTYWWH
jgi:hypothetical protein